MKIDDLKEVESYIELVGTPPIGDDNPIMHLSYLTIKGQGIYGLPPLTHYEVILRGISEYIENKSKEEKSSVIQYFLRDSYQPEAEKYFLKSWQKLNSPYYTTGEKRYILAPGEAGFGIIQRVYLEELRAVRIRVRGHCDELNIETFYPLTSRQQRFLLDLIEDLAVSPDRVYIDDHSKEQCIKRQLRLHFFNTMGELT